MNRNSVLCEYMMGSKNGKLIVFEGIDGSGKGTQTELLRTYLEQNKIPHKMLDFPQYDSFYGKIVAQFLRGEFGNLDEVSPYLAALTFALDRMAVKDTILADLQNNILLIANRYVTSNIAHQAGKFADQSRRDELVQWITDLEYSHHGLPREDCVIYLRLNPEVSRELTNSKKSREYLKGKSHDIQEEDSNHQQATFEMYEHLAHANPHWITIECMDHGIIRDRQAIHAEICQKLKSAGIIEYS